ncbi:MAG: hypothetical protein WDM92_09835 [Caulobacteraceae bacterium]
MTDASPAIASVGLFCGSSEGADPAFMQDAAAFGRILATADVRLVYGGGAIGLMGACAREVVAHGGRVLGVIPISCACPRWPTRRPSWSWCPPCTSARR